jgi:PAS domain-containing protein
MGQLREFFWSAPAYFLSAAVAGMVAMVMAYEQYVLMPLVASPLYLSYRAYQMSVRRLEEERRHAQELTGMIATTQQALARATQSEAALAAEKELLALESARLNVTLRTISDGVISVDRDGMVLLMNEGAQRLAAVSPGDATDGRLLSVLAGLGFEPTECETALFRVLGEGVHARLRRDLGRLEVEVFDDLRGDDGGIHVRPHDVLVRAEDVLFVGTEHAVRSHLDPLAEFLRDRVQRLGQRDGFLAEMTLLEAGRAFERQRAGCQQHHRDHEAGPG